MSIPVSSLKITSQPGNYVTQVKTDGTAVLVPGSGNSRTSNLAGSSRVFGGVYQNTDAVNRRIYVSASVGGSSGDTMVPYADTNNPPTTVIGETSVVSAGSSPASNTLVAEIAPGENYMVTTGGTATLNFWYECT